MTDISQWVNFIQYKQITRLLYYYLFQIQKYFIVYLMVLILTHAGRLSLQMTALEGNLFFPKQHIMTLRCRCSNINLKDTEHGALKRFIWPSTGFSGCLPSTC